MNNNDEVDFWMHMIEWWETNHNEPATKHMRDALALAKSRASDCGVR